MPYSAIFEDWEEWRKAKSKTFYSDTRAKELEDALNINFSYTEQRNSALKAVVAFKRSGTLGSNFLSINTRLLDVNYIGDIQESFTDVIENLVNNLSWREGNVAKDTEEHKSIAMSKGSNNSQDVKTFDQKGFLGQSFQDTQKSYFEQVKIFARLRANPYTMISLEYKLRILWKDGEIRAKANKPKSTIIPASFLERKTRTSELSDSEEEDSDLEEETLSEKMKRFLQSEKKRVEKLNTLKKQRAEAATRERYFAEFRAQLAKEEEELKEQKQKDKKKKKREQKKKRNSKGKAKEEEFSEGETEEESEEEQEEKEEEKGEGQERFKPIPIPPQTSGGAK